MAFVQTTTGRRGDFGFWEMFAFATLADLFIIAFIGLVAFLVCYAVDI
jgi:hypothetical protein